MWTRLGGIVLGVFAAAGLAAGQPPIGPPENEDEGVQQAQFTRPAQPPAGTTPARGLPAVPPTPAVQLVVIVPQDAPPKADLTYTLKITNPTAADAHRVKVRLPLPEGTTFVKSEPKPDRTNANAAGQLATEFYWDYKTLSANASHSIQVTLKPKDDAREVNARAYVSFEHGTQVTTRLNAPKLQVKAETPKQAVVGDLIPVRVTVTNAGKVAVEKVKLTANIPAAFEFDRDSTGEKTKERNQRVWEIGTLAPGGSKVIAFRVTTKEVGELLVQAVVDGSHQTQQTDEAKTPVKQAKVEIKLKGDGATAAGGDAAGYVATVHNTGSLPLTNVRVTVRVPDGCRVTRMTNEGQETREGVTWVIPKLPADDRPVERRVWLASNDAGRKTIRAAVVASQGVEHAQEVETVFKGAAVVRWEAAFDQATVRLDGSGMYTVTVRNTGSEVAKTVQLVVTVPREVAVLKATPDGEQKVGGTVRFAPRDIPAGGKIEYSISFRGEQAGEAHFGASLTADVLGTEPLRSNKMVEVVRR